MRKLLAVVLGLVLSVLLSGCVGCIPNSSKWYGCDYVPLARRVLGPQYLRRGFCNLFFEKESYEWGECLAGFQAGTAGTAQEVDAELECEMFGNCD